MNYNNQSKSRSNQYQPSFVLHIEPNHLIFIANEITGFYMEFKAGPKWVKMPFFQYWYFDINTMVTEKKLSSIFWKFNQCNRKMSIPFKGRPYMLLVAQDYQCHQGKDKHIASKEHYQNDKKKFSNHHWMIVSWNQENWHNIQKKLIASSCFLLEKYWPFLFLK